MDYSGDGHAEQMPAQPQQQQQTQPEFSVDWITPHLPYWNQHVVPRFAGRPHVRVLEIGCWEGRSALWLLHNLADHPTSSLVCVDPFELCHSPFLRNRKVFESNLRAAGVRHRVKFMHMESREALPRLIVAAWDATRTAAEAPPGAVADAAPVGCAAVVPTAVAAAAAGTAAPASATAPTGPPVAPQQLPPPSSPAPGPCTAELFDAIYIDGSHMRVDVLTDAVMAWQLLKVGGVMVLDDYRWDQYVDNPTCHPGEAVDQCCYLK